MRLESEVRFDVYGNSVCMPPFGLAFPVMAEADFLAGYPSVTPELLRVTRRVRLIQVIGAGYDNIDVDAAARAGIPVATAGGTNAVCVAEHIFALILALHRQIIYAHNAVRAGEWPYLPLYRGGVFELSGAGLWIGRP